MAGRLALLRRRLGISPLPLLRPNRFADATTGTKELPMSLQTIAPMPAREGEKAHQITRLRHETRRRRLTVARIERLTANMLRLHFTSDDLGDFTSASFDDHIKVFMGSGDGQPDGRPAMRDFTPRRFDTEAGTIVIDYAVHDAGPAVEWALAAKVGDVLEVGGPRGSAVIPDDFDWYVMIGDESALPAIGRRLEELRAGVPVTTFVLVSDAADAQAIETKADWTPNWIVRAAHEDDSSALRKALSGHRLPAGDGFVWIAAEAGVARDARGLIVDELGHPREWTKAAGYWQRGVADAHTRIGD